MADRVSDSYPAIFSRHAATYAKRQQQIMAARESPARQAALEWVKARPGMIILDLGCGPGTLTFPLARALEGQGQVIGVDLAQGMLDVARRQAGSLPVQFLRMDAETLQFPPRHFDAAICGHSLQFLVHTERVLRELHRVLKPKARFGASIPFQTEPHPALEAIVAVLDARLGEPAPEPPRAQLARDPAGLQRALIGAGFRFAEVRELAHEAPVPEPAEFVLMEFEWWGNARRLETLDDAEREQLAAQAVAAVGEAIKGSPGPIVGRELVVRAQA